MKILRLLASLLVIIAVAGCARQEKPAQSPRRVPGLAPPRPTGPAPSIASLSKTRDLICSNCHTALTVDTGRKPSIAFSHEKHKNRGFHCNQCHISLAHGMGIMPGHPQCFACHDGRTASRDCDLCHLRRSDINPHARNFLRIHGQPALGNPSRCRECHTESFCLNCHTLQMPHPPNWEAIHGQKIGQGDCARCHTQQYCNQCHQRTRPASHQAKDFLQTHGSLAVLGSAVRTSVPVRRDNCTVCHSSQFCLNCHKLPMPHPSNWTSAHSGPGKAQTDVCTRCHGLDECRSCHEKWKIMGHLTQFLMEHIAEAKEPNPDCWVCHAQSFCAKCHPKGIDGKIFPGRNEFNAGEPGPPSEARTTQR